MSHKLNSTSYYSNKKLTVYLSATIFFSCHNFLQAIGCVVGGVLLYHFFFLILFLPLASDAAPGEDCRNAEALSMAISYQNPETDDHNHLVEYVA